MVGEVSCSVVANPVSMIGAVYLEKNKTEPSLLLPSNTTSFKAEPSVYCIGRVTSGKKGRIRNLCIEIIHREHCTGAVNFRLTRAILSYEEIRHASWMIVFSYAHVFSEHTFEAHMETIQFQLGSPEHMAILEDRNSLLNSIRSCTQQKDLCKGSKIHAAILQEGWLNKDVLIGNSLINMYAKCGALEKAQEVFENFPVRNIRSWTAVICGYAQNGLGDKALTCFEQVQEEGLSPDAFIFASVLKACGRIRSVHKGMMIHAEICTVESFRQNIFIGTSLIDMYGKCGALYKAQEVFNDLPIRDVVSWTALISGYAQNGLDIEALNCFNLMREEGISANSITFACILKACGSIGSIDKGEEIHEEMKRGLSGKNIILNNALIDMYSKCGYLEKAKAVFDELPMRDAVSWTSLICGYAHQGLANEAFDFFQQMKDEGLTPDAITFSCTLKACGNMKWIEHGEEIHAELKECGLLDGNVMLGNALIDMYGKCGVLSKAREVFDQIESRDIISWNALINGYVDHGFNAEAIDCFLQMEKEGFHPDVATFSCTMKACSNEGLIEWGERIQADVTRHGLLEILGPELLRMYVKCDAFAKAKQVFDDLLVKDADTWTTMIAGYAQQGLSDKALRLSEQMLEEGISPNESTFSFLLTVCGNSGFVNVGERIHAQIINQELVNGNIVLGNALIAMYVKCGMLEKAKKVFDNLPRRNVISWTSLIAGCVHLGFNREALCHLERMQDEGLYPDAITFSCVLKACADIGSVETGVQIHNEISKNGLLRNNLVLRNALVGMYAKCGMPGKAQEVFDELPVRDVVSWNTLISGYVQHGLYNDALNCFARMQEKGSSADAVTFACILKACADVGLVDKGEEIHVEISKQGLLEKDPVLGNALIEMYAKCGKLAKAQELFDGFQVRDVISWTLLIAAYAKNSLHDEALNCFDKMQDEGLFPEASTFSCILRACASMGSVDKGNQIHAEIKKQGLLEKDVMLGTALVDMYAKCGVVSRANEVFYELPQRDVACWTALIGGYAQLGQANTVFVLFDQMITWGYLPNAVTFIIMLTVCNHAGLIEEGQSYFTAMETKFECSPALEHHVLMVDLFSQAGCFERAIFIIEMTPPSDRSHMWKVLLGACGKWLNSEIGKLAFDYALKSDEQTAAVYVCISNIYASLGVEG